MATEAVLLWPRDAGSISAVADTPQWPVVAAVVARPRTGDPGTDGLFALLDGARRHVSVVDGSCRWPARGDTRALLTLTVHLTAPGPCDVDVVLPTRPLSDVLDVLTAGATMALTSPARAARLRAPLDVHTALAEVVLVDCRPLAGPALAAAAQHGPGGDR